MKTSINFIDLPDLELRYDHLDLPLREWRANNRGNPHFYPQAIGICRTAIQALKVMVLASSFVDDAQELQFFKVIKPAFYQQYLYYLLGYPIQLRRPVGSGQALLHYYAKELARLEQFYTDHAGFYRYWRSGFVDQDELYFLRAGC